MSASFNVREGKERKRNNQYVRCYDLIINITSKYKRRKKNLDFHTCLKIFSFQNQKQCLQVYFSYLLKAPCFDGFAPPRNIFQVFFFVFGIMVCDPLV